MKRPLLQRNDGELGTWFGAGLALVVFIFLTVVAEQRERINTLQYRIDILTTRIEKLSLKP